MGVTDFLKDAGMVLAGGPIGVMAIANENAAEAQGEAATDAAALTTEQAQAARQAAALAAGMSNENIYNAAPQIGENLYNAQQAGYDYLNQGYSTGRQDLLDASGFAQGAIGDAQSNSLAAMYQGANQGLGYINNANAGFDQAISSGLAGANDILEGRQNRGGAMLDAGLYSGFQEDPGYAYRLAESEKAINRSAAARGGRLGGETLKALQANSQGLASQEYGNFVNRRLNEFGAASSNDSASFAADSQLANAYLNAGSQMAGAQQSFGSQAANMAYGSGQNAAGVYGNTGGALANLYMTSGGNLAGMATQAGGSMGANASGYYTGLADLDWQTTQAINGNLMASAGAPMQILPTLAAANMAGVPYAGAGWAALGNAVGQGMGLATTAVGAYAGAGGFAKKPPVPAAGG